MFPCDQLLYGELERKVDTVKYVVIETEKMRESRERMVRRRRMRSREQRGRERQRERDREREREREQGGMIKR